MNQLPHSFSSVIKILLPFALSLFCLFFFFSLSWNISKCTPGILSFHLYLFHCISPNNNDISLPNHNAVIISSSQCIIQFPCCLVTQSCPTLLQCHGLQPPFTSVRGIFQERILEWVVISFSKGSSLRPRDWTHSSCRVFLHYRWILYRWPPGKVPLSPPPAPVSLVVSKIFSLSLVCSN